MKKYKVAILGATGAVGREMMKILAERSFPVEELHLLASERSAGKKIQWQGRELTVEPACDEAFQGMDIVLGGSGVCGQLQRLPPGPGCAAGDPGN